MAARGVGDVDDRVNFAQRFFNPAGKFLRQRVACFLHEAWAVDEYRLTTFVRNNSLNWPTRCLWLRCCNRDFAADECVDECGLAVVASADNGDHS